jgi:hypothetical protein
VKRIFYWNFTASLYPRLRLGFVFRCRSQWVLPQTRVHILQIIET